MKSVVYCALFPTHNYLVDSCLASAEFHKTFVGVDTTYNVGYNVLGRIIAYEGVKLPLVHTDLDSMKTLRNSAIISMTPTATAAN